MAKRTRRATQARRRGDSIGPHVILDVVFEDGLLFLSLRNIGARPAVQVSVRFDRPIVGLEGEREISALPLFTNLEFLAPGREIRTFLDRSASYELLCYAHIACALACAPSSGVQGPSKGSDTCEFGN